MTLVAIQRQKDQIKSIFELAEGVDLSRFGTLQMAAQTGVTARLAEYLCVRTAGFVEQATREIFRELARRGPSVQLAKYVVNRTERDQNVNSETLCQIAGRFDADWQKKIETYMAVGNRKNSLDSVVRNRHKIAHGEWVSIGLVQIKDWHRDVVDVMDYVENLVLT